jgi:hypothetical protein
MIVSSPHSLNMELDLQGLWAPCPQLFSSAETPPATPVFGLYEGAILVGQDRRHLFVTPGLPPLGI